MLADNRDILALLVCIVALAALINRFAADHRWVLRRLVGLFSLLLLARGLAFALAKAGVPTWEHRLLGAAALLSSFAWVNVVGATLFDLVLPRLGVSPSRLVSDLLLGAAYIVATGIVLAESGLALSSVITTGAVLSAVLALSLQTTLGNVLGGVTLQLEGSVKVGDWIQLDGGKQGIVRDMRWRHTVVETRDCDTVIIPNATLLSTAITILGRRGGKPVPHRMWVYFNVDFRYSPARVVQVAQEALLASPIPNVASTPPPSVVCLDFAKDTRHSFAYYGARYFIEDLGPDDPTSTLVRARLHAALRRANIPLARPAGTQFLRIESDEVDARRAARHEQRRLDALRQVALFSSLTAEELAILQTQLEYVPFAAGEMITRQGARAHWLYVLGSGSADVVATHEDGTTSQLATLHAPNYFGEMGLMTGAPRVADVIATSEVECFRLTKEGFEKVLLKRPEIVKELSARLAERRRELRSSVDARHPAPPGEEEDQIFDAIQRFFGLRT